MNDGTVKKPALCIQSLGSIQSFHIANVLIKFWLFDRRYISFNTLGQNFSLSSHHEY